MDGDLRQEAMPPSPPTLPLDIETRFETHILVDDNSSYERLLPQMLAAAECHYVVRSSRPGRVTSQTPWKHISYAGATSSRGRGVVRNRVRKQQRCRSISVVVDGAVCCSSAGDYQACPMLLLSDC